MVQNYEIVGYRLTNGDGLTYFHSVFFSFSRILLFFTHFSCTRIPCRTHVSVPPASHTAGTARPRSREDCYKQEGAVIAGVVVEVAAAGAEVG